MVVMSSSFVPVREEIAGEYNTTFTREKNHRHHDKPGFKIGAMDE
jgi:hypothetical protein